MLLKTDEVESRTEFEILSHLHLWVRMTVIVRGRGSVNGCVKC